MKTVITLLLTLVSMGREPASADAPDVMQRCLGSTRAVLGRVATLVQADPTFELHDYSDQQAMLVLETVNADPPETQFEADRIVTLVDTRLNGADKVLVMLMTKGCLRQIIQVPHKHWEDLLRKSIGNRV